jgi:uncharacterized membrane protein
MVVTSENNDEMTITLSPNRSATWQQSKWIIAIMVAVVMIIALAWTFMGAWLVLPFAGAEVGLFAFLMYKVSLFTHSQQVIHISAINVNIKTGYRKKQTIAQLPRKHLDIFYSESDNNWELPRITLCSKKHRIIIGEFLNLEDRVKLKGILQDAGFIICRNKWWTA